MSCSCHDHHDHHHEHEHDSGEKGGLIRLVVSAALFIAALLLPVSGWRRLVCFLVPYLIAGFPVLRKAAENIAHGEIFDENFLMAVASIGAFCIGEYPEGAAVMVLYCVGEFCEDLAVDRSRRSIGELMDICPETARVLRNGEPVELAPEEVAVGEEILVYPGERLPLDGVVLSGEALLDTAALTGESVPRSIAPGGNVRSGCVDLDGVLTLRVTRPYAESTVQRILALVEDAEEGKTKSESFITRFARIYTPCVVGAAVLLAVIPGLITGAWGEWIRRALTFLVISCPCALVISVPLTFFGGIGGAARKGILIKGSAYLEALSEAEIVAADKTGTLTKGSLMVAHVLPVRGSREELLALAAAVEGQSRHPVGRALRAAAEPGGPLPTELRERPGLGIEAVIGGKRVCAGNLRLMESVGAAAAETAAIPDGTAVHLSEDGTYLGCVVLTDEVKPTAKGLAGALRALGVRKCVILSGDRRETAEALGRELSMDEVRGELSPRGKVEAMRALRAELSDKGRLLYLGDGVNDAPVLAGADVGIAMGALGSDAAVEAADVVLMDDDPMQVVRAVRLAKRTMRIARENIAFALAVKAVVLLLGALGLAALWAAVFADVGVCLLCVFNALRALRETN